MSISKRALANIHPFNKRSRPMHDTAVIPNSRTPEEWAEIIRGIQEDEVDLIFKKAIQVENSRQQLGFNAWLTMTRERLGWTRGTAMKWLAIATDEHGNLAEVSKRRLPPNWTVIYEIARLRPDKLQDGLQSGIIHAAMQLKDIRDLKPQKEKPAPPPEPELKGRELVERRTLEARQIIVASMRQMAPDEQAEFLELIQIQLDDLKSRKKAA